MNEKPYGHTRARVGNEQMAKRLDAEDRDEQVGRTTGRSWIAWIECGRRRDGNKRRRLGAEIDGDEHRRSELERRGGAGCECRHALGVRRRATVRLDRHRAAIVVHGRTAGVLSCCRPGANHAGQRRHNRQRERQCPRERSSRSRHTSDHHECMFTRLDADVKPPVRRTVAPRHNESGALTVKVTPDWFRFASTTRRVRRSRPIAKSGAPASAGPQSAD